SHLGNFRWHGPACGAGTGHSPGTGTHSVRRTVCRAGPNLPGHHRPAHPQPHRQTRLCIGFNHPRCQGIFRHRRPSLYGRPGQDDRCRNAGFAVRNPGSLRAAVPRRPARWPHCLPLPGHTGLQPMAGKPQRTPLMTTPYKAIASLGSRVRKSITGLGAFIRLAGAILARSGAALSRPRLVTQQVHFIGNHSLLIIAVSGLFVGFVLGLQGYYTLSRYGSEEALGLLVALSLTRELGPVVTALLFAGRAGTSLTAEIGLMKAG